MAPTLEALGGPGTIVMPLVLVFLIALLATSATWVPGAWGASAPPGPGAAPMRRAGYLVWSLSLAAPLAAALRGTLFAAMAWGALILLGANPGFRPLVSALLCGEALLSVQALWRTAGALVLALPGAEPGALPLPSGLHAWVGAEGGPLPALARQVTPLHVVWVMFLALAFGTQPGVSRWRGVGTALLLWGLGAVLAVLRSLPP